MKLIISSVKGLKLSTSLIQFKQQCNALLMRIQIKIQGPEYIISYTTLLGYCISYYENEWLTNALPDIIPSGHKPHGHKALGQKPLPKLNVLDKKKPSPI